MVNKKGLFVTLWGDLYKITYKQKIVHDKTKTNLKIKLNACKTYM